MVLTLVNLGSPGGPVKHILSVSLLAVLLGTAGCARYNAGSGTSPYYTSYYNTYDSYRQCYYHCCDYRGRGYGYGGTRGHHDHHDGDPHGGGPHRTGGGGNTRGGTTTGKRTPASRGGTSSAGRPHCREDNSV